MFVKRKNVDDIIEVYLPQHWKYITEIFNKKLPNEDCASITKCGDCIHWCDKRCDELGIEVTNPNFFCAAGEAE